MDYNSLKYLPKLLLITGNGKNVGKTTLCTRIIDRQKEKYDFIAVKISTHFHDYLPDDKLLYKSDELIIIEELKHNTGKDSSKMLDAGAKRVFFIMVKDENLKFAFNELIKIVGKKYPMIVESTSLRGIVKPSLFVVIKNIRTKNVKKYLKPFLNYIDVNIVYDGEKFNFDDSRIKFNGKEWQLD